jgi:hypothetical protein
LTLGAVLAGAAQTKDKARLRAAALDGPLPFDDKKMTVTRI